MDWKKRTPEEKARCLSKRMEEARKIRDLLERFERAAQKYFGSIPTPKKAA